MNTAKVALFKAEIPYLKCFKKAFTQGVPVSEVNGHRAAQAWEAYEAVGKEITK